MKPLSLTYVGHLISYTFTKKNFVVLSEELVRVCFLLASVCMSSNEELRIFFSFENAIHGHPDLDIFDSFEWYFWR